MCMSSYVTDVRRERSLIWTTVLSWHCLNALMPHNRQRSQASRVGNNLVFFWLWAYRQHHSHPVNPVKWQTRLQLLTSKSHFHTIRRSKVSLSLILLNWGKSSKWIKDTNVFRRCSDTCIHYTDIHFLKKSLRKKKRTSRKKRKVLEMQLYRVF